jgi:diguanylate cyclase (GGDEF)-like protein
MKTSKTGTQPPHTSKKQLSDKSPAASTAKPASKDESMQNWQDIELLVKMSDLLQICLKFDEAYRVIADYSHRLFPDFAGILYVMNPETNKIEMEHSWGDIKGEIMVFAPEDCWALRRNQLHYVEDTHSGLRCAHIPGDFSGSTLCAPMVVQGQTLGVLYLQNNGITLTDHHKLLAIMASRYFAMSLSALRLNDALRAQSIRDPMTGLFNRHVSEELLRRELNRAARHSRKVGVILFEVDQQNEILRMFGKGAEDNLLHDWGALLNAKFRGEDIVCRYSVNEFLVILPESTLNDTLSRAVELQEDAKNLEELYHGQSLGPLTLSLGVAVFPQHGSTDENLLAAVQISFADAVEKGRNLVALPPK